MAKISEDVQKIVSRSIENFTTDLYKIVAAETEGNFVSSALSAHLVLAMAAYGAEGTTAQEMRKALYLPEKDEQGYLGFQNFIDNLNNVQKVILKVANKIYANKDINIKDKFKKITNTYFRSESAAIDVSKPKESAETINQWCLDRTNSKIQEIIQPDDIIPSTAMILLNAVYFKGNWNKQFSASSTKLADFHINKTTTVQVPTMYVKHIFFYKDLPEHNAECVILPYENEDLNMVIIVPREIDGLMYIEKNLEKIDLGSDEFGCKREVCIYLPKFKIETTLDMNRHLQQLGMTEMFNIKANFKGIADEPLKVDKVRQKAFIEVNEEGSEAFAISNISHTLSLLRPPLQILKVDRPFIYKIILKNTTLFYGHIVNPLVNQ